MDQAAIQAALIANPSPLRDKVMREVGIYTTVLVAIVNYHGQPRPCLAGTGTFVSLKGRHHILTAAHVWRKALQHAPFFGIGLDEDVNHLAPPPTEDDTNLPSHLMRPSDVIPSVVFEPAGENWNQWGPDLALLTLPTAKVESIVACKDFYSLDLDPVKGPPAPAIETKILMGTPGKLGHFVDRHADLTVSAFFGEIEPRRHSQEQFDYFDLTMDLSFPGMPHDFRGVSGGGCWKIYTYFSAETGNVESIKILEGVGFYQLPPHENQRPFRCHGPESIAACCTALK